MSLDTVIQRVLLREGGIADVGDGAGVTRFGQTAAWLGTFGYPVPETREQAAANYRRWLTDTKLDLLCYQGDLCSDVIVDWAVHSGHPVAIRSTQAALGVTPDGVIGPVTMGAMAQANRKVIAVRVLADRVKFLGRLIQRDPAKAKYAAGWANRLAGFVEAL